MYLELRNINTERKVFDRFPTSEKSPRNETEDDKQLFINHLSALQKTVSIMF
jgi:hypothetical protein